MKPMLRLALFLLLTACTTGGRTVGDGGLVGPSGSPDIALTAVSVSGQVAIARKPWVHFTYANQGTASSGPGSEIGVYLSSTPTATTSDLRVGLLSMQDLEPGTAVSDSIRFRIPANAPEGPAYLSVIADIRHVVPESNRQNDARSTTLGALARPPLAADGIVLLWPDNPDDSVHLTSGDRARWSPDGTELVFDDNDSIVTVSATGADRRVLAPGRCPAWSPTGDRIAFLAPGGSVWIMNSDGSSRHQVAPAASGCIDWSPSSRIIFSNNVLYSVKPDGTDLRQLTSNNYLGILNPRWEPDGQSIIFSAWPSYTLQQAQVIALRDPYGDINALVGGAKGVPNAPLVSPDGASLIYTQTLSNGATRGVIVPMSNPMGQGQATLPGITDWR